MKIDVRPARMRDFRACSVSGCENAYDVPGNRIVFSAPELLGGREVQIAVCEMHYILAIDSNPAVTASSS